MDNAAQGIDVFDYIGANNPDGVYDTCIKHGYNMEGLDKSQAADCARQLCNEVGTPAHADLMYHHPDREIILQYFTAKNPSPYHWTPSDRMNSTVEYRNADGSVTSGPSASIAPALSTSIISKTSLFIIGGAVLLTLGIIFVSGGSSK